MHVFQLLHAIANLSLIRLWLSSGTNETECSSSYEEHSVLSVPLKKMDVPLESLRNEVTICFREVLETAANRPCWWYGVKLDKMATTRSCWWYGVQLDASDPDSLAQLCRITSIELDTMFDACGLICFGKLTGKFSQDVLAW